MLVNFCSKTGKLYCCLCLLTFAIRLGIHLQPYSVPLLVIYINTDFIPGTEMDILLYIPLINVISGDCLLLYDIWSLEKQVQSSKLLVRSVVMGST